MTLNTSGPEPTGTQVIEYIEQLQDGLLWAKGASSGIFSEMPSTTAVTTPDGIVMLLYQADWEQDTLFRVATKDEFMNGYDRDHILGPEGDALSPGDLIYCRDGSIPATDIL